MLIKKRLFLFLRVAISFGLLVALLWIMRHNIESIIDILKGSNKTYLLIAVSIGLPLTILTSYRLKLLMSGQNILLPLKDGIYLTFIGYFFNNFFPTAIGGDIVKAHYASKKTNNTSASYAAVLADRVLGLLSCLSIALIGAISIGKEFKNTKVLWAVVLMLATLIFSIVLLFNKKRLSFPLPGFLKRGMLNKIRNKISKLYTAVNFYRHSAALLVKAYFLAIFMHVCTILSVYFFILCVGGNMPFFKLLLVIPLVWAISMLPSLNGLGVREGAFVYFLKGDIGPEVAFTVSMLWLGVIILYGLIGGTLYLLYPVKIKVKK